MVLVGQGKLLQDFVFKGNDFESWNSSASWTLAPIRTRTDNSTPPGIYGWACWSSPSVTQWTLGFRSIETIIRYFQKLILLA